MRNILQTCCSNIGSDLEHPIRFRETVLHNCATGSVAEQTNC